MFVDAIEEGKIVRVTEDYAKKEGLFILKKIEPEQQKQEPVPAWKRRFQEEKRPLFDDYRKSLHYTKDPMLSELKDNFHWILLEKRRLKNITRKQLALSLGVSEVDIKMIENGVLPNRDFILVNKLEKYYNVNLRKGDINYQDSFRSKVAHSEPEQSEKSKPSKDSAQDVLSGSDIEVIETD